MGGGGGRNSSRGYRHAATSQPESDVVPAALVFEENQIPYVDAQAGHGRIDVTVETWGPGPGCVREAIERMAPARRQYWMRYGTSTSTS